MVSIRHIILLTALSLAGCATGPARDTDLTQQGREAMEAGDAAKAEELLNEALTANPDNPYALTDLAALHLKRYQYDQASALYQRVVDKEADYQEAAGTPQEKEEATRLQQLARERLAFIAEEQAAEQEALALTPEGAAPMAAPAAVEPTPPPQAAVQPEAQTAPTKSPEAVAEAPAPPKAVYKIQIGAFKSQNRAQRMSERLKALPAEVIEGKEIVLTQAGGFIKVHVGPYATFNEATATCGVLKEIGISCFPRRQ